jgi:hypothetical protein
MIKPSLHLLIPIAFAACAGAPNNVEVALAPDVISSQDGTTVMSAILVDNAEPIADESVQVAIDYTDRNGTPHAIDGITGKTNERGVFTATLGGLLWDGTGKVTVTAGSLSGEATFSVLDRTPPQVTILPPTTDNKVGPGLPIDVQVHVSDEIGVGQVILDTTGLGGGGGFNGRNTTLVSGALDSTVTFRLNVPAGGQAGDQLHLYALATDLSGNSAAAMSITLTVDPTITIATPPGLTGTVLVSGTTASLNDPRSIASSAKDGKLYVADVAAGSCNGHCIWQVDPTTGAITPTPVFVGVGVIEGVAFDATGDNLYYSDRQNRTGRLTWNGSAYATPILCNNTASQTPQDPYHLVFDPTLGLLAADGNRQEVVRIDTCAITTNGTDFTNHNFDQARGIAVNPAGEIYVSDLGREEIVKVDRTNGNATVFETRIANPYGVEWLATGTTQYASSLLVASRDRVIESTKGSAPLAAAYLRNTPIDLAFIGGTMYILTSPSTNDRGRIFKVTGF